MAITITLPTSFEDVPPAVWSTLFPIALPLIFLLLRQYLTIPTLERPPNFTWTAPPESKPGWTGAPIPSPSLSSHLSQPSLLPNFAPSLSNLITCYAPASGYHLGTITSNSKAEIREKIGKAVKAQDKWGRTEWAQRRRVMRALREWCVGEMEGIARTASRDTGKTMVDAAFGEILTTAEKLSWLITYGERHLKPSKRPSNLLLAHKISEVRYEPLGVVSAIVSWNYPFHNLLSPIIAALFTGNAIVVKPSEQVAWSSLIFVKAVREILAACGFDQELVQIVVCLPDSVEALTGDERIKHITFIGSEQVGKKVAIKGAETGTPVLLELGGKDPCIILPSADINYFSDTWMRAAFQSAGQNCIGVERFIVSSNLYDLFVREMTMRVKSLKLNDILADGTGRNKTDLERSDVGAMLSDRLFDRLEQLIQSAVEQGARLLVGGKRYKHPLYPNGIYFEPTLLVDVERGMEIAKEELFAPVMVVMKFEGMEEAIKIANGTRYGLGASVFGKSKRDCEEVVKRVKCGMVCTNDFGVFYLNQSLPFGGTSSSGYGRFSGPEGLHGLCNLKSVTKDRFHGSLQTGIPPLLAYPIKHGDAAWQFVQGLVRMAYGGSWGIRAKGLWELGTAKGY